MTGEGEPCGTLEEGCWPQSTPAQPASTSAERIGGPLQGCWRACGAPEGPAGLTLGGGAGEALLDPRSFVGPRTGVTVPCCDRHTAVLSQHVAVWFPPPQKGALSPQPFPVCPLYLWWDGLSPLHPSSGVRAGKTRCKENRPRGLLCFHALIQSCLLRVQLCLNRTKETK